MTEQEDLKPHITESEAIEPTDSSLPLTSTKKNLVQREHAVWGIGDPTFGELLRVIEKHFKDTSKS